MVQDPSYDFLEIIKNFMISGISGVFVRYSTRFWGPTWIYMVRDPAPNFLEIIKTHDFGHFWSVSWAIAHGFGVRSGFKWSGTQHPIF